MVFYTDCFSTKKNRLLLHGAYIRRAVQRGWCRTDAWMWKKLVLFFILHLKMKCQFREQINVPLCFTDSLFIQVWALAVTDVSWQPCYHHQSLLFWELIPWPRCSEGESSISLCTQHTHKKPFPFFPVWLREKAAFFSPYLVIWSSASVQ